MKPRSRGLWIVLLFFGLLWIPAAVAAQEGEPSDDAVNAIAHQLYCPVCENIPLDVCPTQACIQWRATIKEKLALGWTEQQIKDYFVTQYGERVLAQPSARGLNLLVWVLPPIGVLAAAAIYIFFLRRLQRQAPADAPAAAGQDEYARRLEEELAKRR
jgi:cytochrome c-type biogenesis protein CcmH